jgi:hypothetical protein
LKTVDPHVVFTAVIWSILKTVDPHVVFTAIICSTLLVYSSRFTHVLRTWVVIIITQSQCEVSWSYVIINQS